GLEFGLVAGVTAVRRFSTRGSPPRRPAAAKSTIAGHCVGHGAVVAARAATTANETRERETVSIPRETICQGELLDKDRAVGDAETWASILEAIRGTVN